MRRAATPRGPELGAGDLAALSAVTGLRLQSFRSEHVADRIVRAHAAERVNGNGDLAALLRRDERARERFRRSVAVSHSGLFRDPEQFDALERASCRGSSTTRRTCERGRRAARTASSCGRSRSSSAGWACSNARPSWAPTCSRRTSPSPAPASTSSTTRPRCAPARAGSGATSPTTNVAGPLRPHHVPERGDYLESGTKAKLHRMLAGALSPGGVLMLGRSERLGDPAALGPEPFDSHIYERPR